MVEAAPETSSTRFWICTYTPVASAGVSRSARSSASDSGAISSSASSTSVQRRVAIPSDSLRAQPKSLRHSR